MTVVPHGPGAIGAWNSGCLFSCFGCIGPCAGSDVRTRNSGTNAFLDPQYPYTTVITFSADGTASGGFKRRPDSQKRAFQKVDARDLAGKWLGCVCIPFPLVMPIWPVFCTTKKALNEDQYSECGLWCVLGLPIPVCDTRTRKYVNGLPTNGFALDGGAPHDVHWHRDPGCAGSDFFFAKKLC